MTKPENHRWKFKPRFRRHAFGWKSLPAIGRIKEAVAEIKKVAKQNPLLAAEGAVTFLERLSPAIEQVDGSSGSIGAAVGNAISELVPLIEHAPAEKTIRDAWLERLFEAHQADEIPYIERLADLWGNLCASEETASVWVDRLIDATRADLHSDIGKRLPFRGTSACLSALFGAKRFDELLELLSVDTIWQYERWSQRDRRPRRFATQRPAGAVGQATTRSTRSARRSCSRRA